MWVTCHRGSRRSCAIVPSWFRGFKFFSRGYFVGPKFFLVGILWVKIFSHGYFVGPKFFSQVFRAETFSRGCFMGPRCFLVGISWVHFFFVPNFVIQRFSVVGCMRRSHRKQKHINRFPIAYFILSRFQQLSVLFLLERYFIY